MCGIFTITPYTERLLHVAPMLALEIEPRGRDSWGATDGTYIHKDVGEISESFRYFPEWERVIYHTRQASTGSVTLANSHPFEFTGTKKIVGVHNGAISNHDALNTKYDRKCTVDSQHIFMNLAEGKSLEDLYGWGVAVWVENDSGVVNFVVLNAGEFHLAQLPTGEFLGCSYQKSILKVSRMLQLGMPTLIKIDKDHRYCIEGGEVYKCEEMKLGTAPIVKNVAVAYPMYRGGAIAWHPCLSCTIRYIEPTALVCHDCFQALTSAEPGGIIPESVFVRTNGQTQKRRIQCEGRDVGGVAGGIPASTQDQGADQYAN